MLTTINFQFFFLKDGVLEKEYEKINYIYLYYEI